MESPILFIAFKRLDTTKKVFEAILDVQPKKIYIAIDGPRNLKEFNEVESVRAYISNKIEHIKWDCKIKTKFNEKNLGIGFGATNAIDWFFENEKKGIILEDDCVPNKSFFSFCDEMLNYFENEKRVGMVEGFNPFPRIPINHSFFFSKYTLCWGGWATWRDRWSLHDVFTNDWPLTKNTNFLRQFSNNKKQVATYWSLVFDAIHKKTNFSWDTRLSYAFFKKRMLSIIPRKNIVDNIGYGNEGATNTYLPKPHYIEELKKEELEFPLIYPKDFIIMEEWDELIEKVLFDINYKTITRLTIGNLIRSNRMLKLFYPYISKLYKIYKVYFYKQKRIY